MRSAQAAQTIQSSLPLGGSGFFTRVTGNFDFLGFMSRKKQPSHLLGVGKFSAAAFLAKQEEGFHRAFAFDFDFSWFGKFEFIPQQIAESSGNLNLSFFAV